MKPFTNYLEFCEWFAGVHRIMKGDFGFLMHCQKCGKAHAQYMVHKRTVSLDDLPERMQAAIQKDRQRAKAAWN